MDAGKELAGQSSLSVEGTIVEDPDSKDPRYPQTPGVSQAVICAVDSSALGALRSGRFSRQRPETPYICAPNSWWLGLDSIVLSRSA